MPTLQPRLPATLPEGPDATAGRTRVPGQPADPQKYAVSVRPSAIDGQGAFADEPIPAGRKIGEVRGEAVSTSEGHRRARAAARTSGRVMVIAVSERRAIDASASTDPLRYANHACSPNMVLKLQQGRLAFYALRDVEPGTELTLDYGPTHHGGRLACRCGAPRCKGRL